MIRALVDTNVWISALLNPVGFPGKVLDAMLQGRFVHILPDGILDEIRAVLARKRIRRRSGLTDQETEDYIALIAGCSETVRISGRRFGCRDPKDDMILEAAVEGEVEFIVTRDGDLKGDPLLMERMRKLGVDIVSVSAFLNLLSKL